MISFRLPVGAAALMAAFFMSAALAAPPCVAPVKDLITTAKASGIRIEVIRPEKVARLLARLRKLFPDRQIIADEIIAAHKPEGERGLVYLMLAKDGCVISAALMDRESFERLNGRGKKPKPSKPRPENPNPIDRKISS